MNNATKQEQLIDVVKDYPQRTAKEYGHLTGRPHPSIRRDLDHLAKRNIVRRVRSLDRYTEWDGTWEVVK